MSTLRDMFKIPTKHLNVPEFTPSADADFQAMRDARDAPDAPEELCSTCGCVGDHTLTGCPEEEE